VGSEALQGSEQDGVAAHAEQGDRRGGLAQQGGAGGQGVAELSGVGDVARGVGGLDDAEDGESREDGKGGEEGCGRDSDPLGPGSGHSADPRDGRIEDFERYIEKVERHSTFRTPGVTFKKLHSAIAHEQDKAETMFKAKNASMCCIAQHARGNYLQSISRNRKRSEKPTATVLACYNSSFLKLLV